MRNLIDELKAKVQGNSLHLCQARKPDIHINSRVGRVLHVRAVYIFHV